MKIVQSLSLALSIWWLRLLRLRTSLPFLYLQIKITARPARTAAQKKKTPWWIILLSVLGGLLLVAAVIVILYKVSFGWLIFAEQNVGSSLEANQHSMYSFCILLSALKLRIWVLRTLLIAWSLRMCEKEQSCRSSENTRLPPASLGFDAGVEWGSLDFSPSALVFPLQKPSFYLIWFKLIYIPNNDS